MFRFVFNSMSAKSHRTLAGRGTPALPPEIIGKIIGQLKEDQTDILKSALVCRAWVTFSRNYTHLRVTSDNVKEFIRLVTSPNTLLSNIRRLHIIVKEGSRSHRRLLPLLPRFASLRSLTLWSLEKEELPHLPLLTYLDLAGIVFPSYGCFHAFMAELPALKDLRMCNVSWETGNPDKNQAFPKFNLDSFDLDWGPRPPTEEILFAMRPRRLGLAFPEGLVDPPFLNLVQRYLRFLGTHLRHLILNCDEQLDLVTSLDFRACTALEVLHVSDAVSFNVESRVFQVSFPPDLPRLLARITPHCTLRRLVLGVQTADYINPRSFQSLDRLDAVLDDDAANLGQLEELEFRVDGTPFWRGGSARASLERCAPLIEAAIPSTAARRVVCVEGQSMDYEPMEDGDVFDM
ncbi:hypothetical protein C8R43DRAFT_1239679 [Mycena crocata]|nr:hypothetical protein C8R43DRAFT_1239679 [Mycena crocata]